MDELAVRIECEGSTSVPIDELNDLQGNLKDLSEEDYIKQRNAITEFGFSFPVFYWEDETGKKWIIDAHQRKRTLLKMRSEGWIIPPLPACNIHAKDRIEAKKKLLLLQSRYGKITSTGMTDYLNEQDYLIPFEEIQDFLTYPEDDFEDKPKKEKKLKEITCPECQAKFTL